jgi:hypothetical protein
VQWVVLVLLDHPQGVSPLLLQSSVRAILDGVCVSVCVYARVRVRVCVYPGCKTPFRARLSLFS